MFYHTVRLLMFIGWEFSTILFVGFNFFGFLIIGVGYSIMYISINRTMSMARGNERKKQITLAKNMMLIVLTDFVCWLPIIAMGEYADIFCTLVAYHCYGCVCRYTLCTGFLSLPRVNILVLAHQSLL